MEEKILIADDESLMRRLLEKVLEQFGYNNIYLAVSGPECVEIADKVKPDLVIMDISMPGEYNGLEAAKRIYRKYGLPVIFLTAFSQDSFVEYTSSSDDLGTFGYIEKPFEPEALKAEIFMSLYRHRMENKLKDLIEEYKKELNNQKIINNFLSEMNNSVDPFEQISLYQKMIINNSNIDGLICYKSDKENNKLLPLSYKLRNDLVADELKNDIDMDFISDEGKENLCKEMNIIEKDNLNKSLAQIYKKLSVNTCFSYPLNINNEFYGIVGFIFFKDFKITDKDKNFLLLLSNVFSVMIKRHLDFMLIKKTEQEKFVSEKLRMRSERLASLGQLSSAIAHEINQPLQSIKILSDSVIFWSKENKSLPYNQLIENFSKISDRVDRIDKIVKHTRMMLKSPDKIKKEVIDINKALLDAIEIYREKLKSKIIDIELILDDNVIPVEFSLTLFYQVINNLLNNAINALDTINNNNKKIVIRTKYSENKVSMEVSDNGPGIEESKTEKIFEPFYSSGHKKEGLGMGLYLIYNILRHFDYKISVENNKEGGASFVVKFF